MAQLCGKVKIGKDQEMAQSQRNSHSKNRGVENLQDPGPSLHKVKFPLQGFIL